MIKGDYSEITHTTPKCLATSMHIFHGDKAHIRQIHPCKSLLELLPFQPGLVSGVKGHIHSWGLDVRAGCHQNLPRRTYSLDFITV